MFILPSMCAFEYSDKDLQSITNKFASCSKCFINQEGLSPRKLGTLAFSQGILKTKIQFTHKTKILTLCITSHDHKISSFSNRTLLAIFQPGTTLSYNFNLFMPKRSEQYSDYDVANEIVRWPQRTIEGFIIRLHCYTKEKALTQGVVRNE